MPPSPLDDQVRAAIAASSLCSLPQEVIDELTAGASRLRIPARSTFHHEGEDSPHLELVLSGLVRVQVAAADGRTMTVRYARPGALLGVATLYAPVARRFGIQALSDSELLAFRQVSLFVRLRRKTRARELPIPHDLPRPSAVLAPILRRIPPTTPSKGADTALGDNCVMPRCELPSSFRHETAVQVRVSFPDPPQMGVHGANVDAEPCCYVPITDGIVGQAE